MVEINALEERIIPPTVKPVKKKKPDGWTVKKKDVYL